MHEKPKNQSQIIDDFIAGATEGVCGGAVDHRGSHGDQRPQPAAQRDCTVGAADSQDQAAGIRSLT